MSSLQRGGSCSTVNLAAGLIVVERSKTTAGERAIDLQPELRDELIALKAAAPSTEPDALVFPTRNGTRRDRHNIRQRIVLASVECANVRQAEQGRVPLPEGLSPALLPSHVRLGAHCRG